jgi:hypothetical protein
MNIPGDPHSNPGGLGKKVDKPAMPEAHKKIRDGVYQGPDGKLYTNAPAPPPPPSIYDRLYGFMKP